MSSSEPSQIPLALAENVARGSCVLFLGADAPLGEPGPPTRGRLAAALAEHYDLTPGQSLPATAGQYLARHLQDRHGLIAFLRKQSGSRRPTDVHRAIVDLDFDAVVTAWYDDLLEKAYDAAGQRVARVVAGPDMVYAGHGEDVLVVKLYGDVNQPDSLVVTQKDMLRIEGNLARRLEDVRPYVRLRPIVFLGWDPADEGLARLYLAATESLGEHRRHNYIVWADPRPEDVASWREENVEIIPAAPLPFLRALRQAVERQRRVVGMPGYQPGEIVGKLPYKFLNYFDPDDRDIFCGREVEAPLVYRLVLSYPLLTLFGQSGVGKTSLLRAGAVPLLVQEGYRYAYVRTLGDPLQDIRDQVCQALNLERAAHATLLDFFKTAVGEEGKLVVILDQLEELFTRPRSEFTRQQFWRQLGACIGMAEPEVRFILCLREDFLAHLDEARRPLAGDRPGPIPNILRYSHRLSPLNTDTAYLAIVEPARRARCEVEPLLADVLLGRSAMPGAAADEQAPGGPARRQWSLVEADGQVPPPSLQIVMDRLYRAALAEAGHAPPGDEEASRSWQPPRLDLSLDLYRRLGGAGHILGGYVQQALDAVSEPKYGGDRYLAVELLKVMVSSQKTKTAMNETELAEGLAEACPDFDPENDIAALRATLAAVVNLRLVRSLQVADQALYELAHDHMAAEIATWIGADELQTKLAREQLRREMESWHSLGKLIEPAALKLIHARRDDLRRLDGAELELLFRSALAAGYEVAYWFRRAQQGGADARAMAVEGLTSDNFRSRTAAVNTLGKLGEQFVDVLVPVLADHYPQVRAAAIHVLERLQPGGEWRTHLKYECFVPAGGFIMGDDRSDQSDEKPAHRVVLAAFYIGKYPVTNADYKRCMDDLGRPFDVPRGKTNHPVIEVSWYDARDYAAWAGMRLLTEAEWEKAASWEPESGQSENRGSGGKKRRYPWGDEFDASKCNTYESGIGETTPVGRYSPQGDSFYGCADMAGNVWEWLSSLANAYPYRADDGREDRHSAESRVMRGGSWSYYDDRARTAYRGNDDPNFRDYSVGLRVGLSSTEATRVAG